ncbi:hypothetical protein BCE02nite_09300 [Brevibacillus centrosporus]|nr:hypothetical protein BCE02nite_09300 [Brevibacillus centrosporus]
MDEGYFSHFTLIPALTGRYPLKHSGNKRKHNYRCQEHSFGWRPWMTDKRWETFLHGFGLTMGERIGKGGKWKWQQLQ